MEILLAGLVLFFVLVAEVLRRKKILDPVFARKILHIGAISISAISVFFFNRSELLLIIGIATPILAAAVLLGFFRDEKSDRKSYGILYYAISFYVLVYFFAENQPNLVYYPLMILAWADGLATVVGYFFGRRKFDFSPEGKTLEGALTFLAISFIILMAGCEFAHPEVAPVNLKLAIFLAVFLAMLESLSIKSLDNIWVPGAVVYWILIPMPEDFLIFSFIIPLLAYFALRQKWLTSGGAIAASLLGWVFLINPNPEFIVFPTWFFMIGSILSKLPGHTDKGSHRNANQVFANGGVPALFFMAYFVWQDSVFMVAGVAGFAFALSDTAASEIGIRMGGQHYRILKRKKVEPGISGAVTLPGSLAGTFFAFFIAAVAFLPLFEFNLTQCLIIAGAGIAGNIADSLIGDLLQAKYVGIDGTVREYPMNETEKPFRGYSRITNGTTNFLASGFSCLLGLVAAALI